MKTLKNMDALAIDVLRNICAICLNNEAGIKLYKMKIIEQFFVDIVGISQTEYENTPKLLCVWCASRASHAMQLISRARTSAGVLSRVRDAGLDGNTQLLSSEFRMAKLDNFALSRGSVMEVEIVHENCCDVVTEQSVKSELSAESDIFDKNEDRDNEEDCRVILKRKTVKRRSRKRNYIGVKTENGTSGTASPHGSDHDLTRLQFSVQELTEDQQLAELERRRQTEEFGDARYKCSHCALVFLCAESEKNHADRHKETAGPNICPICKLRFASRGVYCHHRLSHRRVFSCVPCGRRLRRRTLLRRHRSRCPVGPASEGFRCGACEREFGDRESIRTHYRRAHSVPHNALRCEHCEKTFARKYDLVVHIRSHTREKPYSCPHCRRAFSVSSNLRAHITLVHQARSSELRARPYCVECDRHFTTARSLTRHLTRTAAHQQKD